MQLDFDLSVVFLAAETIVVKSTITLHFRRIIARMKKYLNMTMMVD